jgi:hypothetical protein
VAALFGAQGVFAASWMGSEEERQAITRMLKAD